MTSLTASQKLAVESIDSHVLVSAGAGSGKTHVLVERYIEILRQNPKIGCANLLAVTYTRKAASEMRTRLKSRIQQLLESSTGENALRWSALRAEIDGAKIGTIHSLCESILKSFPEEAVIDPAFEVLDDLERAEFLQQSIEETIQTLGASDETIHAFLSSYTLDDIQRIMATLINQRLQFQEIIDQFESLSDDDLNKHFLPLLERAQALALSDAVGQKAFTDNLQHLIDNPIDKKPSKAGSKGLNDHRLEAISFASTAADTSKSIGERFAALNDLLAVSPRTSGGNEDLAKSIRAAIRDMKNAIEDCTGKLPNSLSDLDFPAYSGIRCLTRLTQEAIRAYEKHKQQRLDYSDLIWLADRLISKKDSGARRYFNNTLSAILVDEFQDTNLMQSKLLAQLAGKDTRLFFIGDDKQSIYKFQGADVSIFNNWRQRLSSDEEQKAGNGTSNQDGENGVSNIAPSVTLSGPRKTVSLQDSFRSHQALVNFVNVIFSQLLIADNQAKPYAAKHAALTAHRSDNTDDVRVDVTIFDPREGDERNSKQAQAMEAAAIANWIEEKVQACAPIFEKHSGKARPIAYGDFAILVQQNKDFSAIEEALAACNIPYVTHAGAGYLNRQEIYDIENCLRFLACPQDSHALLGILRSPIFSISDDVIFALSQEPTVSLWTIINQEASLKNYATLKSAVVFLRKLLTDSQKLNLSDIVRRVIAGTKYDITLMGLPNGRQRSRNLWKFVWFCHQHNEKTIADFIVSINTMRQLNIKNSDAPVDCPDAVKLMTIHASKGLEFSAVILPVLSSAANDVKGRFLMHPTFGMAFDTTRNKDETKPPSFEIARYLEKDMLAAEKKRLFYVAMTRARDYLALFVERGAKSRLSFRLWLNEILAIDSGDELTADGIHAIAANGTAASYRVTNLDQTLLADKQAAVLAQHVLHKSDNIEQTVSPDFSLMEAVTATPRELAPDWLKTVRVTNSQAKLDATTIGIFFHSIIERMASKSEMPSDSDLINIASAGELRISNIEIQQELLTRVKSLLSKFYPSTLANLIAAAKQVFYEMPYVTILAGSSHADDKRTDLILQDANGQWHVIDFKTDHFDLKDLDHKISEHKKQLEQYKNDLENITGVKFQAKLYFAEHALLVEVK